MQILSSLLLIAIVTMMLIGIWGCSSKEEVKPCVSKVEVVKEYVPVACDVPDVNCEFSGDNFTPTQKLLECVVLQKKALDLCKNVDNNISK